MPEPLIVAAAQPLTRPHDVAANVAEHVAAVRAAAARVVVFPELSLTGYELDADALAPDDSRLAPLVAACDETGTVALAGAPVTGDAGRLHIAVLAIDRWGVSIAYRKMWLGSAEAERFTAGSEPAVLAVDGWRLGLAVCRDTGIERHAADTAALGIDGYLAGVLEAASDAAIQDQRARRVAATHRIWVVVASFAGATGGGYARAAGGSSLWAPGGTLVARAGPEPGALARAVLSHRPSA